MTRPQTHRPVGCLRRLIAFLVPLAALVGLAAPAAAGSLLFEVRHLGLTDAEHTRDDGLQYSESVELNHAGQVVGYANRYNGGSSPLGQSIWLYDGATTTNVVPGGIEHTRDDGYQFNSLQRFNDAGQVLGNSNRYNGGNAYLGESVWLYDGSTTTNIGLTGTGYTRDDGYRSSSASRLNGAGQVLGSSQRYNGSAYHGVSIWLSDGSTTQNVGLTGAEHTRDDGFQFGSLKELSEGGQAIGYSYRFNGGSAGLGQSAWLYDGATTQDIGLTDTAHTRDDGYRYSVSQDLNEAGQVVGQSDRFNGSASQGISSWFYDGSSTTRIGLTGAEHTRADGTQVSTNPQINEAGQVRGYSTRYDGSDYRGQSAWLYDGSTTHHIGLTGAEHTRDDGYQYAITQELTEFGQVRGYSDRFNGGSADLGQSAWLYDGSTTHQLGLTGAEHTRSDGFQYGFASEVNAAGQAIGFSRRYNGSSNAGQSAWLFDGSTTLDLSLTGTEYTYASGARYSYTQDLNEAGQVTGVSTRYNGGTANLGQTAWLYDGSTTLDIGLTGTEYIRDDDYRYSTINQLTEAGQVRGYSQRYDGSTDLGQDGWVYDPVLGTVPLQLSLRDDGFAYSSVEFLGEDGLALGYYRLYSGMTQIGDRAFYWSADDGLWDLGSLVNGGLAANGWEALYRGLRAEGLDYLSGFGLATGLPAGSRSEFLLVSVPEPSGVILAAFAACGLVAFARRRRRISTARQSR